MRNFFIPTLLLVFCLIPSAIFAQETSHYFVDSQAELDTAGKTGCDFKWVAFSADFYRKQAPEARAEIQSLVKKLLACSNKVVVAVYGKKLNVDIANEILGLSIKIGGQKTIVVWRQQPENNYGSVGYNADKCSEDEFRQLIVWALSELKL